MTTIIRVDTHEYAQTETCTHSYTHGGQVTSLPPSPENRSDTLWKEAILWFQALCCGAP
jgi:hypothetical protein